MNEWMNATFPSARTRIWSCFIVCGLFHGFAFSDNKGAGTYHFVPRSIMWTCGAKLRLAQRAVRRVVVATPLVAQLAKKFPHFCGTQKSINVHREAHHWPVSWARLIQLTASKLFLSEPLRCDPAVYACSAQVSSSLQVSRVTVCLHFHSSLLSVLCVRLVFVGRIIGWK
jgi:hypothetical protein